MTVTDADLVGFCEQLLGRLGMNVTPMRVGMLLAWCWAEGGWAHNNAAYNPMNTTQPAAGSHPINSVGVQAYTTLQEGLDATEVTLTNGRYGAVLIALQGQQSEGWAGIVGVSPWGTSGQAISAVLLRALITAASFFVTKEDDDMGFLIACPGQPTFAVGGGVVVAATTDNDPTHNDVPAYTEAGWPVITVSAPTSRQYAARVTP